MSSNGRGSQHPHPHPHPHQMTLAAAALAVAADLWMSGGPGSGGGPSRGPPTWGGSLSPWQAWRSKVKVLTFSQAGLGPEVWTRPGEGAESGDDFTFHLRPPSVLEGDGYRRWADL